MSFCVLAVGASACIGGSSRSPALQGEPPYEIHQEVLAAADLRPLRTMRLPEGEREVRIWVDVAIAAPNELYRFRIVGDSVRGEMVRHWPAPPPDRDSGERPGETSHDLMLYGLRGSCTRFRRQASYGACRSVFARQPDWATVLDSLDSAGLWVLPDESTLPGESRLVLDGWGMIVELRAGESYRSYRYSNPDAQPWPEAAQAVRIVRALGAIDSLMRDPDVVQVYRGVTPGSHGSEFRTCGGREAWEFEASVWDAARMADTVLGVQRSDSSARVYVEVRGELSPEWLAREWGSPYPRVLHVWDILAVDAWTGVECGAAGPPGGLRSPER